jgi:hypothetical protein
MADVEDIKAVTSHKFAIVPRYGVLRRHRRREGYPIFDRGLTMKELKKLHQLAAEHYEKAAEHHRMAGEHAHDGNHEAAAQHAHVAHGHAVHAYEHASHASKKHVDLHAELAEAD